MPQSENENAVALLLGSEILNRQGDTASLSLTKIVNSEANCLDCLRTRLKAQISLISQKYQKMLARCKEAGCPDLGE